LIRRVDVDRGTLVIVDLKG